MFPHSPRLNAVGWELLPNQETDEFDCYSASLRNGGVRSKQMKLPPEKWDLVYIGESANLHHGLGNVYARTKGKKYDWLGALGVLFKNRHDWGKWFCSEFCAAVLGFAEPWRCSSNDLADIVARDNRRVRERGNQMQ